MGDLGVNWSRQALLGARIIEDLLLSFDLHEAEGSAVDAALRYLADVRRVSGEPISARVWLALHRRGLL